MNLDLREPYVPDVSLIGNIDLSMQSMYRYYLKFYIGRITNMMFHPDVQNFIDQHKPKSTNVQDGYYYAQYENFEYPIMYVIELASADLQALCAIADNLTRIMYQYDARLIERSLTNHTVVVPELQYSLAPNELREITQYHEYLYTLDLSLLSGHPNTIYAADYDRVIAYITGLEALHNPRMRITVLTDLFSKQMDIQVRFNTYSKLHIDQMMVKMVETLAKVPPKAEQLYQLCGSAVMQFARDN